MLNFLLQSYRSAAVLIGVGTLLSVYLLTGVGLVRDYSLEAFVASDSESYRDFRRVMDEFVSNEFAVVALHCDDVSSDETMKRVTSLAAELRTVDQVQRVTSYADVPSVVRAMLGDRIKSHPLFQDTLVSRDGKTTVILLQMAGESTGSEQAGGRHDETRKRTVERLRNIVAGARKTAPDTRMILAGPYVTLIDMYDYVDRDLSVFSTVAFVLLVVTLAVVFRRPSPAIFAIVVSVAATLCTLGITSALHLPTALITQMIVILTTVLSVANCVHLAVAEDEAYTHAPFYDWRERTRRVLRGMAAPCSAVMATTAAGFGSICISSITPVRTFGLLMVIGLGLSLVFSLTTVAWLARSRPPASSARGSETLTVVLRSLATWVDGRRVRILCVFGVVVLMFAAALLRLRFESDFVKSFRPESEVRRSYEFLESHLAPTGSVEVVVRAPDGRSIVSPDTVSAAREFGRRAVASYPPVRKALSIADILTLNADATPSSGLELDGLLALARNLLGEQAVRNFLNESGTAMRINLRVSEGLNVGEKLALSDEVESLARDTFGQDYDIEVTGLYHFYAVLVAELWRDQFRSLGVTFVVVLAILMVVLRSFKAGALAMVPTALPVVFCLGAMGWTSIPVNMTTAMMLSVTLGIAVDDALHYLWRFRSALRESGDYHSALRAAHGSVGRACVFTTVVIATGFSILTLSEFLPTAYFGGLLAFTMLTALASDLLLLPAMVMIFRPFPIPSND